MNNMNSRHAQAIALRKEGKTVRQIMKATGYSQPNLNLIFRKYGLTMTKSQGASKGRKTSPWNDFSLKGSPDFS